MVRRDGSAPLLFFVLCSSDSLVRLDSFSLEPLVEIAYTIITLVINAGYCTMDQGENVVNACVALDVEIIKCNCHRVNSAALWSLGISGAAARCKNKAKGELMKKLAECVGVFSHSAVSNDMLKELQKLEEDIYRIYEFIRRNDTRCFVF